jgi:hypothetical protein
VVLPGESHHLGRVRTSPMMILQVLRVFGRAHTVLREG